MGEGEVNSREAIERAFGGWPENRLEFTRALAIVSKKDSRDNLQIALEIIFSESNLEPAAERQRLQVKEIAAKAANDRRFLLAIDGLHEYYSNGENAASSDQYKTLEIQREELQLHKIEADPYFRSLKLLLETSSLYSREHQNIATDDIILGTLQFVSDIRDDIPAMDSYLKTEYQQLSDQAENFAVALIDEVRDEEELSTVIKMEDKFSEGVDDVFEDRLTWMREGIEKVSLIQHAINLRCKTFVVSKNCQHLLKEVIFGRTFYRFWDDPRVKTGTGMPTLLILLMKVILSFLCGVVMTLLVPAYILISLVNWCLKNKHCSGFCEFYLKCCCCQKNCCGFCELYERPCQKYLLELWWFIAFLSLVFITSDDNDFSQKDLSSRSGLTYPYIFVFAFVVAFWLRFLTRIPEIPCCRLPDILTVVEFASLLCFTISIIWWIIRWEQLDGWRPSDSGFQDSNISYSVASLLCFFKLAHYLKAQYTLGTLNLSLYMMITYDVIYFAIIFVSLLFVPFGNALKKMYSYYEVDNMNNATHALARRERTYGDLFWRMLGSDMRKDIEISDPNYAYMKVIGEVFIAMFAVAAVVVALNMLIATMDYTCKNIMENVDKEYVFSRTKMWIEYIAEDHSVLPPPLNLADIIKLGYKCSKCFQCKRSNETSQEDIEEKRKKRISIIKRLVLRYLRRSLIPDSTEYFQPGNPTSQPHNEPGNPTVQVVNEVQENVEAKRSGNETSQPHNEQGNETSQPPNEAGNETSQPHNEPGNQTSQPPNEPGNETSQPPNESGNETSQPHNEAREPNFSTTQRAFQAGNENPQPPNEAGNETSQPPNEAREPNFLTTQRGRERNFSTTQRGNTRKRRSEKAREPNFSTTQRAREPNFSTTQRAKERNFTKILQEKAK